MANGAALGADLAEIGGAKIVGVYGHHGRTLRAAVALEWTNAEVILERLRDALLQLFRPGHHDAQAAEGFGRAAPGVGIKKRGRREQHAHGILADQCAYGLCVERARVKDDANAGERGQAECARETEGVEEGKNAEDAITIVEMEDLFELLNI